MRSWIFSIITPVFSVTWSLIRNYLDLSSIGWFIINVEKSCAAWPPGVDGITIFMTIIFRHYDNFPKISAKDTKILNYSNVDFVVLYINRNASVSTIYFWNWWYVFFQDSLINKKVKKTECIQSFPTTVYTLPHPCSIKVYISFKKEITKMYWPQTFER